MAVWGLKSTDSPLGLMRLRPLDMRVACRYDGVITTTSLFIEKKKCRTDL